LYDPTNEREKKMTDVNYSIYSQMQTGKPIKTYQKTITAQLTVTVMNSFSGRPEMILLTGDGITAGSVVKLWNEKEVAFFVKANGPAIERGALIEYKSEDVPDLVMRKYADSTDEELDKVLDTKATPWFALTKIIAEIDVEPVLIRLLTKAREQERSEKVITLITERLSAVQGMTGE
jgi:hypothetical protein